MAGDEVSSKHAILDRPADHIQPHTRTQITHAAVFARLVSAASNPPDVHIFPVDLTLQYCELLAASPGGTSTAHNFRQEAISDINSVLTQRALIRYTFFFVVNFPQSRLVAHISLLATIRHYFRKMSRI
ncbi:hypothetical protein LTR10_002241 [Elasticomyces elasticus]|nr:hypothetical protein LTR10_002241 [Elasticomyces elasticus]KAK4973686.1 hypothetical protein LTR42_005675 [Elasticomyces elasticus]